MGGKRLWAVSDVHVGHAANRRLVAEMDAHPGDWLVIAGDVAERVEHVEWTLRLLRDRYEQLVWVPGNHELWRLPQDDAGPSGVARYERLVEVCQALGVLTPEDPYPEWPDGQLGGQSLVIAPLFLLYDYSFRDPGVTKEQAIARARATRAMCADEYLLPADPFSSREAWCAERVRQTQARLDALAGRPTVLVNHFPLRRDLAVLPRIPAFELWCGTTATEDWHVRYRAAAVVTGHTHMPGTRHRDGVRFEEVSLGYPREWALRQRPSVVPRQVLPGPDGEP